MWLSCSASCWKPGLPWLLWTLSSLCHSWIQELNAVICFSLWCQKPKHSILSFVWILSLYCPSWTSHNLKLAALNTFGSCEPWKGERKRKCSWMCASDSELLALSLITSFCFCFPFFSFFRGFLGSPLVEFRGVSAFLWLCTAFVSLARCAGPAQAQYFSLNSRGQSRYICFYF